MEQRPLRLGDILDDYCPRERRVTNHAIVALVEDTVKQTRCTACDSEHVYKGGKAPRRKKADSTGRLYKEVLAGLTENENMVAAPEADIEVVAASEPALSPALVVSEPKRIVAPAAPAQVVASAPEAVAAPVAQLVRVAHEPDEIPDEIEEPGDAADSERGWVDEGPVHRPLIRATLARPEGVKIERPIPDFTIRHNHNGNGRGNGNGNGGFRDTRGGSAKPRGNNGQQRFGRGPQAGGGGGRNSRGGGASPGFGGPRSGGGGPRRRGR